MRAAVYCGPGKLAVEEVPYQELDPKGLILKVETCDICGSDLRTYEHGMRAEKEQ